MKMLGSVWCLFGVCLGVCLSVFLGVRGVPLFIVIKPGFFPCSCGDLKTAWSHSPPKLFKLFLIAGRWFLLQ